MNRLSDPNRIVIIERKLRNGTITSEYANYWIALMVVAEVVHEQNTASLWIRELDITGED